MLASVRAVSVFLAAWLLLAAPTAAQNANLVATIGVSNSSGLGLGDEVLVSMTVRNDGPDPADRVFISAGQGQWEVFLYELVGSESPACGPIDQIDLDPPQYSFFWRDVPLPVGSSITCVARLRVIRVPASFASQMYGFAQPANPVRDPELADNFPQLSLHFAAPDRAHAIPASSWWTFAILIAGVLLGGSYLTRR